MKETENSSTVCDCGGHLKTLIYMCGDPWVKTDIVEADGERARRALTVCEDCGLVYAKVENGI